MDCINDGMYYKVFQLYAKSLRQSRTWTYCVNREREGVCGVSGAITLFYDFNPYAEMETLCRYFEVYLKIMGVSNGFEF